MDQILFDLANALRHRLSDSHRVDVIQTGGNVWCVEVVAPAEDEDDTEVRLTIGNAGDAWGFDVEVSLGSGAVLWADSLETAVPARSTKPAQIADAIIHAYRVDVAP